MDNIKIIRKIGAGMLANVYICSLESHNYALKVEKIATDCLKYNLSFQEWREVEFSQNFANSYPNQFITLCDYKVCLADDTAKQYIMKKSYSHYIKDKLTKKNDSSHCMKKLYSLVDDNLKNVIDEFSNKQIYTTIAQVAYICFLLQSHGYTHGDLHLSNIGVIRTDDEHVKIFDKKVKTYGIHIKAIDFGVVLHEKYDLDEDDICAHKYSLVNEINRFLIRLVMFDDKSDPTDPIYLPTQITKIVSWSDEPKVFDEFVKHPDYKLVKTIGINPYDRFFLYQILYPEKFQKMYLKDRYIRTSEPSFRCDLDDILYCFKNKLDLKKIIKHFDKKL